MSDAPYRRLPGIGRSWVAMHGAWEGDTHLLCVESFDFMERYRRFYYREIQALIIEPTRHRQVVSLLAGLGGGGLALFFGLAFGSTGDSRDGLIAGGIVAGLFAAVLLVNTLLGPGARLTVVTAVQAYALPGIRRRNTALKFIGRIQPRILAAQAGLAAPPGAAPVPDHPPGPA